MLFDQDGKVHDGQCREALFETSIPGKALYLLVVLLENFEWL
jgi:hypothetical protein